MREIWTKEDFFSSTLKNGNFSELLEEHFWIKNKRQIWKKKTLREAILIEEEKKKQIPHASPPKNCWIPFFLPFTSNMKRQKILRIENNSFFFPQPKDVSVPKILCSALRCPQNFTLGTSQFASEKIAAAFNQHKRKMWDNTYNLFNPLLAYIRYGCLKLSQRVLERLEKWNGRLPSED